MCTRSTWESQFSALQRQFSLLCAAANGAGPPWPLPLVAQIAAVSLLNLCVRRGREQDAGCPARGCLQRRAGRALAAAWWQQYRWDMPKAQTAAVPHSAAAANAAAAAAACTQTLHDVLAARMSLALHECTLPCSGGSSTTAGVAATAAAGHPPAASGGVCERGSPQFGWHPCGAAGAAAGGAGESCGGRLPGELGAVRDCSHSVVQGITV